MGQSNAVAGGQDLDMGGSSHSNRSEVRVVEGAAGMESEAQPRQPSPGRQGARATVDWGYPKAGNSGGSSVETALRIRKNLVVTHIYLAFRDEP